ncbi:MAG TPA: ABC transporter substrate binding protein [Ideonella sp.]|uniref:ABC transporter substrate binding protein n=1 Tax=Ideonella sp. TaxID=1929293 RepID=UPI002E2F62F7|nr:ABC transporter substrate binding protein [Ideonella sp.]HEX5685931.1 ABC transporter substrate binding protein [Ideonella sp.]
MPSPPPPQRRRLHLQAVGIAALTAAWPAGLLGAAEAGAMAVVYPEIGEPFRSVFASIIEGIREQARHAVPGFAVGAETTVPALADELRKRDVRVVIALGRSGLKTIESLDRSVGVVAGCVLAVPETQAQAYTVHSLAPDPALIFAQLRRMLPAARRVWAVHDPQQNAWLMRLAQESARPLGLELAAQEASDLQRATRAYQDIIAAAEPQRDVLWLPQDSTTVEEATLVPLVLQEAWRRNFAVISSNAQHVRRGALFALYPDNRAMGRSLALSAIETLAGTRRVARGLLPLRDVLVAANQRTAAHLGLEFDPRNLRISKLYPES